MRIKALGQGGKTHEKLENVYHKEWGITMQKLIIAIVVLLFIFVGDGYSNTLLVNAAGDIFAETDRYQVRFTKGSIVHLHNKLTKETYTHQEVKTIPDSDNYLDFNNYRIIDADFLVVEKVAPLTAKLTAVWRERQHLKTLTMWVSIDTFTGDLVIKQEGSDLRHGAATIAWRLWNLDHNQVSVIVPANGGLLIDEAKSRKNMGFEFYFPGRSWQARLAILHLNSDGVVNILDLVMVAIAFN